MRNKFLILIISFQISAVADLKAQVNESNKYDSINSLKFKSHNKNKLFKAVAVPTGLIAAGTFFAINDDFRFRIRDERNKHFSNFHTKADDYLVFTPVLFVYGLNMAGVKGKHDFTNRTILLIKSEMIASALTFSLKEITNVARPDGTNNKSFPSGHSAHVFTMATFMVKEYGEKNILYSIGAYSMATAVGTLRVLNNRHWISDVITGAGIGIISTNLIYLTHQYKWGKKGNDSRTFVLPSFDGQTGLVSIVHRFQ